SPKRPLAKLMAVWTDHRESVGILIGLEAKTHSSTMKRQSDAAPTSQPARPQCPAQSHCTFLWHCDAEYPRKAGQSIIATPSPHIAFLLPRSWQSGYRGGAKRSPRELEIQRLLLCSGVFSHCVSLPKRLTCHC